MKKGLHTIVLMTVLASVSNTVFAVKEGSWVNSWLVFNNTGDAIRLKPHAEAFYFGRDNPISNNRLPGGDANARDYIIPRATGREAQNKFSVGFQFTPQVSEVTYGTGVYWVRTSGHGDKFLKIKLEAKATGSSEGFQPLIRGGVIKGPIWHGGDSAPLTTGLDIRATLLLEANNNNQQHFQDPNKSLPISVSMQELGRINMTVQTVGGLNEGCCGSSTMEVRDVDGEKVILEAGTYIFRPQSCTVSVGKTDLLVQLKSIKKRDIQVSGKTIDGGSFEIELNCQKLNNIRTNGVFNPIQKVAVTFTAINSTGEKKQNPNTGTDSILYTERGDGKADGVDLKILHKGTEVKFGPESSVKGNPGEVNVGQITSISPQAIPFTVQYVNTGGQNVKGGKVQAKAAFTISYQ